MNDLDQVAATPMLSRQQVDFQMDTYGNYELEITNLPDTRADLFTFESPPSDLPQVARTVMSGNQLSMYEANGSLIYTETVDPITFPVFADLLKDGVDSISQEMLNQILSCLTQQMPMDTLLAFLNDPPSGVIVQSLTTGVVSVMIPVPRDSTASVVYSSVHLIDINNKMLLGTRLYDEEDHVLISRMYNYDNCTLTAFTEESIESLPSGETVIVRTIGKIEDLLVSVVN